MTLFTAIFPVVDAANMDLRDLRPFARMGRDAAVAHKGQFRELTPGLPFDTHPRTVRRILRSLGILDIVVNGTARLHDVIEGTNAFADKGGGKDHEARAWGIFLTYENEVRTPVEALAIAFAVVALSKEKDKPRTDDANQFAQYVSQMKEWADGHVPPRWESWMEAKGKHFSEEELSRLARAVWRAIVLVKLGDMLHNMQDKMSQRGPAKINQTLDEYESLLGIFEAPFAQDQLPQARACGKAQKKLLERVRVQIEKLRGLSIPNLDTLEDSAPPGPPAGIRN